MDEDGDHSRAYSAWASSAERSSRTNAWTLKEETTRPAALTLRLQQKKFDRFRQVFNDERPHEGLNNATPGSVYQPSTVLLPRNPIEFVYPHGFMLRRVNNSGDISWHKGRVFISEVFRFEVLGLEQVDEDFYKVYFRDVQIGEFDAEALRFRPVQSCDEWIFGVNFRQTGFTSTCREH